ncbi:hypothetical protein [Helicobacter ailurogastricus]|uniref:hypothetical protein n=1 Tax=Helicobacter ailurogastricus TaxID=1578720 RepID=UPI0006B55C15|nr:hypothetical protein [Helicobacter ailurogastricus]BDQ28600.1 hypothetical protein ASB7_04370 [Helicobacter ailurogastricus]
MVTTAIEKELNDLDTEIIKTTKKFQLEPYTFTDCQERMQAKINKIYMSALKVEKPTPQDIKTFTNEIRRLLRLRKAPAMQIFLSKSGIFSSKILRT